MSLYNVTQCPTCSLFLLEHDFVSHLRHGHGVSWLRARAEAKSAMDAFTGLCGRGSTLQPEFRAIEDGLVEQYQLAQRQAETARDDDIRRNFVLYLTVAALIGAAVGGCIMSKALRP